MPLRVVTFGLPIHKQLELEDLFTGPQTEFRHADGEPDFGEVLAEFDPTHVLVLTPDGESFVKGVLLKRGSPAKVIRMR